MQYFGIPTCPYCKKHVNLVRTWRLKREGEYKCPRCGGISNIYLSPLVYVFAVLAICAGVCIYFKRPVIRRVQREAPRPAPQRSAEPERRAPSRDDTFTEMNTGRYRENSEPESRVNRRV